MDAPITTNTNYRNLDYVDKQVDKLIEMKKKGQEEAAKKAAAVMTKQVTKMQAAAKKEMDTLNASPSTTLPTEVSNIDQCVGAINSILKWCNTVKKATLDEIKALAEVQAKIPIILAKLASVASVKSE